MARPGRLELPTLCLEGRRSIQLSYGRISFIDSNRFTPLTNSVLDALTFYAKGRSSRLVNLERRFFNLEQPRTLTREVLLAVRPACRYNSVFRERWGVLVQPEMERGRSPLVSIPPFGRGFSSRICANSTESEKQCAGTITSEFPLPKRSLGRPT